MADLNLKMFETGFNRQNFDNYMKSLFQYGPGYLSEPTPTPLEPKTQKERRPLKIEELYRLPICNAGDIPRKCLTCVNSPTEFVVVHSASTALCYHFCNDCQTKYLHKSVPERGKENDRKSNRPELGGSAVIEGTRSVNDYGEPVSDGVTATTRRVPETGKENGGVETSGLQTSEERIQTGEEPSSKNIPDF